MVHLPDGIDKNPYPIPSLQLTSLDQVSLHLTDLSLYVNDITTSSSLINLHTLSVSQIPSLLPSGVTATLLKDGPAELLLFDQVTSNLPAILNIATNPLWYILAVFSRMLEARRQTLYSYVNQINIRSAVGMWLDWWSASLGIQRLAGEPDDLFVQRVVGMTLAPNVNNLAISQLLQNLGMSSNITEPVPGEIQLTVTYGTNPNQFSYSQGQIGSIIDQMKAVGIVANVNFQAPISDSFSVSDTISSSAPGGLLEFDNSQNLDESTIA